MPSGTPSAAPGSSEASAASPPDTTPPTLKPLSCSLCDRRISKYEGLSWHLMAMLKTAVPQPGGGLLPPNFGGDDSGGAAGRSNASGVVAARQSVPRPARRPPPPPSPPPRRASRQRLQDGGGADDGGDGQPSDGAADEPTPPSSAGSAEDWPAEQHGNGEAPEFMFEYTAIGEAMTKMDALIQMTRRVRKPTGPARKKKKTLNGSAQANNAGYEYATVAAEVRQHFEDLHDWESRLPLVTRRKNCRPGLFSSCRLRLVERFALECGGGGLSLANQEKLFNLLDAWDRTKPDMPVDGGHYLGIRDAVPSINAFKNAIKDYLDDAIEDEGWLKANIAVDGETYQAIFRPALTVGLERMRRAKTVKLWSGGNRPAPPTNAREHPMDGDAF